MRSAAKMVWKRRGASNELPEGVGSMGRELAWIPMEWFKWE